MDLGVKWALLVSAGPVALVVKMVLNVQIAQNEALLEYLIVKKDIPWHQLVNCVLSSVEQQTFITKSWRFVFHRLTQ